MATDPKSAWEATLSILEQLHKAGYTALLAGGCVRDRLLGREPKDYDIATDARPDRVRVLFPKSRLVGVKFGVVLVHRYGFDIEVTTFRSDGVYSDGRHPDQVTFGDEKADALRRDFTINGLFYDPVADRVIDYVGGQADLNNRLIRTIGEAERRFTEDHLRMLRAVRLSARLGFPIEPSTGFAIQRLAQYLTTISPERIWMELEQILTEPTRATGWRLLCELGLRAYLSPHWPLAAETDEFCGRRLGALPSRPVEPALALSAVLPDSTMRMLQDVCESLRLSNQQTGQVCWLKTKLLVARRGPGLELADLKPLRASPLWPSLLELLRADLVACDRDLKNFDLIKERGDAISLEEAAPPSLVTGDDLLAIGFQPGPIMGKILQRVYRAQLNEEIKTQEEAIALARSLTTRRND